MNDDKKVDECAAPRWMSAERRESLVALLAIYKAPYTERGLRCLDLMLVAFNGAHHFPKPVDYYDWTLREWALKVVLRRGETLDTYDSDPLTRLVFLAHDLCIRVEISTSGMHLCYTLSPRDIRGAGWESHPTLERAVARWRERNEAPPEVVQKGWTP